MAYDPAMIIACEVFLSWSGNRSKAVAEGLGAWLAQVIQAVEPWISSGIEKGARWQSEIAERLDEAKVGIVCLTSSNLTAPWILFEAGALSKTKGSYVCTFLLDVTPADVEPPLSQFQHTLFTREDVLKLVRTINDAVKKSGDRSLTDQVLTKMFDTFWLQLESQFVEIKNRQEARTTSRPERELLEEMLEILRSQDQRARKERDEEKAAMARALARNWEFGILAAPLGSGNLTTGSISKS
jgi:TIR domain-containing protein